MLVIGRILSGGSLLTSDLNVGDKVVFEGAYTEYESFLPDPPRTKALKGRE
jgi:hypothetical protein